MYKESTITPYIVMYNIVPLLCVPDVYIYIVFAPCFVCSEMTDLNDREANILFGRHYLSYRG